MHYIHVPLSTSTHCQDSADEDDLGPAIVEEEDTDISQNKSTATVSEREGQTEEVGGGGDVVLVEDNDGVVGTTTMGERGGESVSDSVVDTENLLQTEGEVKTNDGGKEHDGGEGEGGGEGGGGGEGEGEGGGEGSETVEEVKGKEGGRGSPSNKGERKAYRSQLLKSAGIHLQGTSQSDSSEGASGDTMTDETQYSQDHNLEQFSEILLDSDVSPTESDTQMSLPGEEGVNEGTPSGQAEEGEGEGNGGRNKSERRVRFADEVDSTTAASTGTVYMFVNTCV